MTEISNNSILFIGLANEYCQTLESCANYEKNEFVDKLLKLLPRIYIAISDFNETEIDDAVIYLQLAFIFMTGPPPILGWLVGSYFSG